MFKDKTEKDSISSSLSNTSSVAMVQPDTVQLLLVEFPQANLYHNHLPCTCSATVWSVASVLIDDNGITSPAVCRGLFLLQKEIPSCCVQSIKSGVELAP
jgi:hypothetical protein